MPKAVPKTIWTNSSFGPLRNYVWSLYSLYSTVYLPVVLCWNPWSTTTQDWHDLLSLDQWIVPRWPARGICSLGWLAVGSSLAAASVWVWIARSLWSEAKRSEECSKNHYVMLSTYISKDKMEVKKSKPKKNGTRAKNVNALRTSSFGLNVQKVKETFNN